MVLKADNIQIALFTRPGTPQPDALQVWNAAYKDTSPDGYQRGNNSPMAISTANGSLQGHFINIHSQLGRIDFLVSPINNETTGFPPAQLKDTSTALKIIQKAGSQAIAIVKPVRVGLVCNMTEFLGNMSDVIERLRSETGSTSFPDNSLDHIFQYNVQKIDKENNLKSINRIITFGSGVLQQLSGTFGLLGSSMSVSKEQSALTLKIDINSLPNHDISSVAENVLKNEISEMEIILRDGVKYLL